MSERLTDIDLNLLVYLDLLLEERSVTGAASRAGITQSAMSRALQRLRHTLKDDVLIGVGRGMAPTPRALALRPLLSDILRQIDVELLGTTTFDALNTTRTFSLGGVPPYDALLASCVIPALTLPKGTVAVTEEPADLTLGVAAPSTGFDSHKLFNDPWVCLVRDGHPGVKKKKGLNLERFLNYAHVTLGRDAVDRALRQTRNRRREAARVRDPWQLASIIQHTDHLSVLPKSVAGVLAAGLPVRWVALPLVVPPQTVSLSWPTQRTTDPAHQWLRREVTAALEKIGANS